MSSAELAGIITQFHEVTSINLYRVKGFKILQRHDSAGTPLGLDFTVENPDALARQVRGDSHMAEDPGHKGHYAPWTSPTTNFGFTEVTQPNLKTTKWPKAVHIDFAIGASKCPCGIHLDQDHRVVGRDQNGMAVCTFANDPIVKQVIHVVGLRRIPLNNYKIRPIRVYDDPDPQGFDFESPDIAAIEAIVRSLSTHNEPSPPVLRIMPKLDDALDFSKKPKTDAPYRHDNSRDITGWVGNRVTLGQGYREKGFGVRVHIELDKDSNLGNVHLDTHPYINPDGTPNLKAAAEHGNYDLFPGFGLAGRRSRFTWRLLVGGTWTPKGSRESVEIGVSMKPIRPIEGWTLGVTWEFRFRKGK